MDGVSGVVLKPISGAKQKGVEGFFKGVGKGVVGLVTRPTAGVIDFASGLFGAVKRYALPALCVMLLHLLCVMFACVHACVHLSLSIPFGVLNLIFDFF